MVVIAREFSVIVFFSELVAIYALCVIPKHDEGVFINYNRE